MGRWLFRLLALLLLAGLAVAAWFWWDMRQWRPSEELYPEQGAVIESGSTETKFETLKALGGDFVYLELGSHRSPPDPGFAARLNAAHEAGLQVGILHPFDPCAQADPQSARFTRMVPRDPGLLPPAIGLTRLAKECEPQVSDAAVESELMTLVNQIEMHTGKPAILKLGSGFEGRHRTARSLDRDLWLMRDRARPNYAPRPWLLWSANSELHGEASETPLEWVVVQR